MHSLPPSENNTKDNSLSIGDRCKCLYIASVEKALINHTNVKRASQVYNHSQKQSRQVTLFQTSHFNFHSEGQLENNKQNEPESLIDVNKNNFIKTLIDARNICGHVIYIHGMTKLTVYPQC